VVVAFIERNREEVASIRCYPWSGTKWGSWARIGAWRAMFRIRVSDILERFLF
jgi:hypothetical protein